MYVLNNSTAFKEVKKAWGYDHWYVNNPDHGYCMKGMTLEPGHQCSLHRHAKAETFLITEGKMIMEKNGLELYGKSLGGKAYKYGDDIIRTQSFVVIEGDTVVIESSEWHRFISAGLMPCKFIEVSQFHSDSEVQRVPGEESR